MIGLRTHARDRTLPARAGDAELVPPSDAELLARLRADLARAPVPLPDTAELVYARWKPRTALVASYAVGWPDGTNEIVTWKRYAGDKGAAIAASWSPDDHVLAHAGRLAPFRADAANSTCFFAFPADRALPGLARALDVQRLARLAAPLYPEHVRWRRSSIHVLRYKPERRAVLRCDLVLRDARGELCERRLALRVLPPAHAARVHAARSSSVERHARELTPGLRLFEARSGLLGEEWLDVRVPAPADFAHAHAAGVLLAELHALPAPGVAHLEPAHGGPAELFATVPELRALDATLPSEPRPAPRAWIHGDLHPDQVAFPSGGGPASLLDLDALHAGEPAEDLASWIADDLAAHPDHDFTRASAPLLAGYAERRATPGATELRAWTARELRARAAGAMRRLETDAIARARALLLRAREVRT